MLRQLARLAGDQQWQTVMSFACGYYILAVTQLPANRNVPALLVLLMWNQMLDLAAIWCWV